MDGTTGRLLRWKSDWVIDIRVDGWVRQTNDIVNRLNVRFLLANRVVPPIVDRSDCRVRWREVYSTHTDPACGCTMYQLTRYTMTDILYIRLMGFVDLIIKRAFYIFAVRYMIRYTHKWPCVNLCLGQEVGLAMIQRRDWMTWLSWGASLSWPYTFDLIVVLLLQGETVAGCMTKSNGLTKCPWTVGGTMVVPRGPFSGVRLQRTWSVSHRSKSFPSRLTWQNERDGRPCGRLFPRGGTWESLDVFRVWYSHEDSPQRNATVVNTRHERWMRFH